MGRPSLIPSLAIVLGLAFGATACGDDKADTSTTTEAPATTEAPTTKAPTTTGAETDDTRTDDTETTIESGTGSFEDIDLGQELNPIGGFTYQALPDDARGALLDALGSSPEVTELVSAVGSTTVTDDSGASLLIFLGLNRELSEDEAQQLVDGVTEGGTDLEQGEVAGQTGWAYVSSDGQQGFVTVRANTVIVGLSDSTDHLAAVITGLFDANPEL